MVNDLIPWVDSNFRTLADQPHRAMAGLSMGAMQTRMVTLANIDKFSHIGLFSGGTISMDDVNNTPGFKEKVKLVFVSYGSREIGANRGGGRGPGAARGFGGDPQASIDALKTAGINAALLRFSADGTRVPELATEPARVRPAAVQGQGRRPRSDTGQVVRVGRGSRSDRPASVSGRCRARGGQRRPNTGGNTTTTSAAQTA